MPAYYGYDRPVQGGRVLCERTEDGIVIKFKPTFGEAVPPSEEVWQECRPDVLNWIDAVCLPDVEVHGADMIELPEGEPVDPAEIVHNEELSHRDPERWDGLS